MGGDMGKRHLPAVAVFGLLLCLGSVAQAHDPQRIRSAPDVNEFLAHSDQHGPQTGHLPATRNNVDLVAKLRLTSLEGGIADVGYFKGFAYLNAWSPNCPDGGGVNAVDVRGPENPSKVGFLAANSNEYPGEGVHVMEVHTPYFDGDLLFRTAKFAVGLPAARAYE